MKNALVTGGGGFLGSNIIRMLLDKGIAVRSLQRSDRPDLKKLGIEIIRGDISDRDTVITAAEGCDVIFHVAAKAGVWGNYNNCNVCSHNGRCDYVLQIHECNAKIIIWISRTFDA